MPTSPERAAEAERRARRVAELVDQGLELRQVMARLGISKGTALRLMRQARQARIIQPLT
jgi:transposase